MPKKPIKPIIVPQKQPRNEVVRDMIERGWGSGQHENPNYDVAKGRRRKEKHPKNWHEKEAANMDNRDLMDPDSPEFSPGLSETLRGTRIRPIPVGNARYQALKQIVETHSFELWGPSKQKATTIDVQTASLAIQLADALSLGNRDKLLNLSLSKMSEVVWHLAKDHVSFQTTPAKFGGYKGNPDGKDIYPVEMDHGYDQPLSGGWDLMKSLQNKLLVEQGREPRASNPRIASDLVLQRGLLRLAKAKPEFRRVVLGLLKRTDTGSLLEYSIPPQEMPK